MRNKSFFNYFLVFLLIGVSGIPYFIAKPYILGIPSFNILTILFLYCGAIFIRRHLSLSFYFMSIIGFLLIIIVGQTIWFDYFEVDLAASLIIRFAIPYFIIMITKETFTDIYIKVLFYLSLLSLVLFLPSQIFKGYNSFVLNIASFLDVDMYAHRKSFIFYTIDGNHSRNAGSFWEAGAFCAFLVIGLIFSIIKFKKVRTKEFVVFSIALLTTFSTGGYIAYFLLLIGYYKDVKKTNLKPVLLFSLFLISAYLFVTQDFLQEKINRQFNQQVKADNRMLNLGRFQSAILDYYDIIGAPYFGRGRGESRYKQNEDYVAYGPARRSNGISDFIAKQGIPFSIFFFCLIYYSLRKVMESFNISPSFSIISFLAIMAIGFSQLLFTHPFFAGLIYIYQPLIKMKYTIK